MKYTFHCPMCTNEVRSNSIDHGWVTCYCPRCYKYFKVLMFYTREVDDA